MRLRKVLLPPFAVFLVVFLFALGALAQRVRGGRLPTVATSTTGSEQGARFITGTVVIEDGTPLTDQATIQSICRGQRHAETHTDSAGNFNFEFGKQRVESDDIESSSMGKVPMGNTGLATANVPDRLSSDCELLAIIPGFTSEVIELSRYTNEQMLNINVGKIVLHRVGDVEGLTISATTAAAPSDARKAFEKAHQDEAKGKLQDAQKHLEKAVSVYPNFAVAWVELGRLQVHFKNLDQAQQSFMRAMQADSKLATPYQAMAELAFQQRQWQAVVRYTEQLLQLNALSFPDAWFYNAVGNFYLNKVEAAEKSARETLKTDLMHRVPKADYLLATILMQKKDFTGAAEHFRAYLAHLANPSEAAKVQAQIADAERLSRATVGQTPVPR